MAGTVTFRVEPSVAEPDHQAPVSKSLGELSRPADNSDELLRHRFLCRGGGLLLVGPSGIGKSSFSIQAIVLFSIGRECFEIKPVRPMRIVLIQAENDDGDIAEMRDGVIAGLALTEAERLLAFENVRVVTCDDRTGQKFISEIVDPIVAQVKPDIVWIDPANSFIGGDVNSQEVVGGFLRNGLNPVLHRHNCAVVIVHHTKKPPSGAEKSSWSGGDLAYLGSGSAEWTNWARGVVAIRSMGNHEVFELCIPKRGGRVGWKGADGSTSYSKHIAHAKESGVICWREAELAEVPRLKGRPKAYEPDDLIELMNGKQLPRSEIQKLAVGDGWSVSTFKREWKQLSASGKVQKSSLTDEWRAR